MLDPVRVNLAESEIDRFIAKRATQRDKANAEADLWTMSERRHRARLREERLRERLAYHQAMLRAHSENFEELMKRHRVGLRLCAEALGVSADEGAA